MPDPLVRTTDLHKSYGSVAVLRGLTLDVAPGERVAVLGKSGSGKSTLLHLIGGLDVPTSGQIVVAGRDLGRISRNERAEFRLACVGIIFQAFHLIPNRSAVENVELPMAFAAVPVRERRRQAAAALDAVGLGHRLKHRPAELSGGERQRVAVARALANEPCLLLADEPTGSLDSESGRRVLSVLDQARERRGMTLIVASHDPLLGDRPDRYVRMVDGRIVGDGAR